MLWIGRELGFDGGSRTIIRLCRLPDELRDEMLPPVPGNILVLSDRANHVCDG